MSGAITYLEKSGCLQAAKVIVDGKTRTSIVQKSYGVAADRLTILDVATAPIGKLIEQYRVIMGLREPSEIQ